MKKLFSTITNLYSYLFYFYDSSINTSIKHNVIMSFKYLYKYIYIYTKNFFNLNTFIWKIFEVIFYPFSLNLL